MKSGAQPDRNPSGRPAGAGGPGSKRTAERTGRRRPGGFTLIEVVIATVVLTLAVFGVVSVTTMIVKGNSFSKTLTTATTLAREKMEQLKNTGYDSLSGGTDTQASIYTRTWTVTADGTPAAGMKTIDVNVQWTWQGAQHALPLRTLAARR